MIESFIAVTLFLAAIFFLLETYQKDESKPIRDLISSYWEKLNLKRYEELPILGVLAMNKLLNIPFIPFMMMKRRIFYLLSYGAVIGVLGVFYLYSDILNWLLLPKILSFYLAVTIVVICYFADLTQQYLYDKYKEVYYSHILEVLSSVLKILIFLFTWIESTNIFVHLFRETINSIDSGHSLIDAIILFCIFYVEAILSLSVFLIVVIEVLDTLDLIELYPYPDSKEVTSIWDIFPFSPAILATIVWGGFVITLGGVVLGFAVVSEPPDLPLSFYVSNVVFDLFTVSLTGLLVYKVLKYRSFKVFLRYFSLDLFSAGLFAVLSVQIGYLFSLDQQQFARTLQFLVFDFSAVESSNDLYILILMHTTFVPTAIYLSIIFWLFIAKLFLKGFEYLFVVGDSPPKPYQVTRAFFLLLASIAGLIKLIVNKL